MEKNISECLLSWKVLISLLIHHCQQASVTLTQSGNKIISHDILQYWAVQTGYMVLDRTKDCIRNPKILLCLHLSMGLFASLLAACIFSSSFKLLSAFKLEIFWKKAGGLTLPLPLMLQDRRAM